ncbi:hypothetical protein [Novosphingobium sp. NDB2Meth1]|uniref:hypothetical protein n=1 Tax=Novosphingobium sp. NDB2Meth1 TaxID=1892847 RepID=UPI00116015E4|nr:hypothetical protein [Novosphingobium sp. NDB2Meth1]
MAVLPRPDRTGKQARTGLPGVKNLPIFRQLRQTAADDKKSNIQNVLQAKSRTRRPRNTDFLKEIEITAPGGISEADCEAVKMAVNSHSEAF